MASVHSDATSTAALPEGEPVLSSRSSSRAASAWARPPSSARSARSARCAPRRR
ncbi:hypothetical protein ACFQZC_07465 [Streptacidiphilus monticola]